MTADLIAELADWEAAGAAWRVVAIGPEHAEVALLTCTGETVEYRATDDPAALAALRRRGSSEADLNPGADAPGAAGPGC
jgi:hypothetical protein